MLNSHSESDTVRRTKTRPNPQTVSPAWRQKEIFTLHHYWLLIARSYTIRCHPIIRTALRRSLEQCTARNFEIKDKSSVNETPLRLVSPSAHRMAISCSAGILARLAEHTNQPLLMQAGPKRMGTFYRRDSIRNRQYHDGNLIIQPAGFARNECAKMADHRTAK